MTISFNLIALRGQARTMRAVPVDENMAVIKKVGVIGAGQMGNGIAHVGRWRASMWCSTMFRASG